jgi:hypothetical protein
LSLRERVSLGSEQRFRRTLCPSVHSRPFFRLI